MKALFKIIVLTINFLSNAQICIINAQPNKCPLPQPFPSHSCDSSKRFQNIPYYLGIRANWAAILINVRSELRIWHFRSWTNFDGMSVKLSIEPPLHIFFLGHKATPRFAETPHTRNLASLMGSLRYGATVYGCFQGAKNSREESRGW